MGCFHHRYRDGVGWQDYPRQQSFDYCYLHDRLSKRNWHIRQLYEQVDKVRFPVPKANATMADGYYLSQPEVIDLEKQITKIIKMVEDAEIESVLCLSLRTAAGLPLGNFSVCIKALLSRRQLSSRRNISIPIDAAAATNRLSNSGASPLTPTGEAIQKGNSYRRLQFRGQKCPGWSYEIDISKYDKSQDGRKPTCIHRHFAQRGFFYRQDRPVGARSHWCDHVDKENL